MARIVIINPRFDPTFWNLHYALPIIGLKSVNTTGCLSLLAALTPADHEIVVVDENVEDVDFDQCARADIVAMTGMNIQRRRMTEILTALKQRGCFTVVGGMWITASEDYFGNLVDVKFIGEADETWPQFLLEWTAGHFSPRYEQSHKTDMTTVPTSRWDVLKMDRYHSGSLQISRGCPFTCEFCDIIVTFGRQPRLKTSSQVMAELDALKSTGVKTVFIVDDNLIGDIKRIKPILRDIAHWQEHNAFPFLFVTQASINMSDDPDLVELLVAANTRAVFIGIETPNIDSLRETGKLQNIRRGRTMLEKIHDIQKRGIEVQSGMIVGFDSDDASIFQSQIDFINKARIPSAMLGMLSAVPKTPLYDRLAKEGRLDTEDFPLYGTNVIPAKLGRQEMLDGYAAVTADLYDVDAYFDRVDALYLDLGLEPDVAKRRFNPRRPWRFITNNFRWIAAALIIDARLLKATPPGSLRVAYKRRLWRAFVRRPLPVLMATYAVKAAIHFHAYQVGQDLRSGRRVQNTL